MIGAHELVVDNFAGGGGASVGLELALNRPVDIAVNHSPEAVAMHEANHPRTRHYQQDVWEVDPVGACAGRPVGVAWFSPDCRHFSRAKGGKPKSKKVRSLAWVVVRWAKAVKPRVIICENVEEFMTWGPLLPDGKPDPERVGETFRTWLKKLRSLGYRVEHRSLTAADYGAPTTRRRLFVVARCDGAPITWPEPTHGEGLLPYRTAAEIIDWSIPCPSIFTRRRPLAEATQKRIAAGLQRYVIDADEPYIVDGCIAPTLVQTGYGERPGQAPRVLDLHAPLTTVVASGQKHGLVAAWIAKHYTGVVGHGLRRPLGVITTQDHHALTCAFLIKYYGTSGPVALTSPLHVVTTRARFGLVRVQGEDYEIHDIGMRMLQPRELFRAQGFPSSYVIRPSYKGKPLTKTKQIHLAGNSVCPPVATALVRSLFGVEQEQAVAA